MPVGNTQARVFIKIEQIARMRIAGIKDVRICDLLNISQGGLSRILNLPEYKDHEAAILQGHLTQMDSALAGRTKEMHQAFECAVPAAMRTLVEAVTQRRDLRAAIDASREILDRDPKRTFAKASRQDVSDLPGTVLPAEVLANADTQANELIKKAAP